ncbi:MAG: hypothetical protein K2V38_09980, partial [Gemmataceae bacterium]|nr:hypothetical protein [Gemmataceae bacterium]
MRNFRRSVWFSWPYRGRLLVSVGCALVVAVLWSVNLGAIFPVLKLLSTKKNLHQWVDEEVAEHERQRAAHEEEIEKVKHALRGLDADAP